MNSVDKTEGGPFTRVDPSDPTCDDKKACLDLIIMSKELLRYMVKLVVDKERKITPCRVTGQKNIVFTDHSLSYS